MPFLLRGYDVVVADTEGATVNFAAGPEYGMATLDSLRAALHQNRTGVSRKARIGLIGYSGGAIATNWAAALAPSYAPDINRRLVGATEGGVLVQPSRNLRYIEGSLVWSGVLVMALVGIARGYDVDFSRYLNPYGKSLIKKLRKASIATVLGAYPGLTWKKIAKKKYDDPEKIPLYVTTINRLNLGRAPVPTVPMFIGQGAGGEAEGTRGTKPGIGRGDGVMVAGDVRSLARRYCHQDRRIMYREYPLTSHVTTVPLWLPEATQWLNDRFAGTKAPRTCGSIAKGNPLTPLPTPR